jgi:hypothetical protein
MMPEAVVLQRVELVGDLEDHVAATAAVATVWTAARHVLLPAEAEGTGTAVAALDEDLDAVGEHQSALARAPVSGMTEPGRAARLFLTG